MTICPYAAKMVNTKSNNYPIISYVNALLVAWETPAYMHVAKLANVK